MREIAARAGVATITVSRALSDPDKVSPETRERILAVIRRENFIPNNVAGSMRSAGRMVATVVPPIINAGIAEQVRGMSDACQDRGYQLLLIQGELTATAEEHAIRSLIAWRPAGMILQAFVQSRKSKQLLADYGAPVVEISEVRGRKPIDSAVGVSNFDTAYAMTRHLAAKGYQRIGFVGMPAHGNDRLSQRRVGYRQALKDAGLAYDPAQEIEVPMTLVGGSEALQILMGRGFDPDVIFFSSDTLAMAAIQECHRRRWKVPSRIAIAGYGDLDFAEQLYPALTTVRIPRYQMGRRAVDELLARLSGERPAGTIVKLDFQIVDRESA